MGNRIEVSKMSIEYNTRVRAQREMNVVPSCCAVCTKDEHVCWLLNAHFARKNVEKRTNKVGCSSACNLSAASSMRYCSLLLIMMMMMVFPGESVSDAIPSCKWWIGNLHLRYAIGDGTSSQFNWIKSLIKYDFETFARARAHAR